MPDVLDQIAVAVGALDSSEKTKTLLADALSQGVSATEIAERGVRRGLEIVGQKYEGGEYFLSELLYAGTLVSDLFEILKPAMKDQQLQTKGMVVLGTVRGDIHDIGKNIFKMLADSAGFDVHDLGVDVELTLFVDEIQKSKAQLLGLSALLTTSLGEMRDTVHALRSSSVGSSVRVLLGGNAVKKEFGAEIGADDTALDAVEGLEICRRWTGK